MENKLSCKITSFMMKAKNKVSSIFSRIFKREKSSENKEMKEYNKSVLNKDIDSISNLEINNYKKKHKNVEFVNLEKKKDNLRNSLQSGFFIIAGVILLIVTIVAIICILSFASIIQKQGVAGFNINRVEILVKEFFVKIFYGIAKWILCFVDIVFSYIKRLCGLEMDFTSLSKMFAAESDMVFNLLITAEERATAIVRNLVALAIVMIIVFTIIALVKAQSESLKKISNVMETIKRTIRAYVLLLITPMIALGGIVVSDLMLQTLYKATANPNSMSLGTQIFSTASISSNAYRTYAQGNQRIPIVCNFDKEKDILKYYETAPMSDKYKQYLKSANNLVYMTYMSFVDNEFIPFTDLNNIMDESKTEYRNKAYYGIYDIHKTKEEGETCSCNYNANADLFKDYMRFEAYAEEYYVMADVIDYAVNTRTTLFMETIEDVLDSITKISDVNTRNSVFSLTVQKFGLRFYRTIEEMNDSSSKGIVAENSEFIDVNNYLNRQWEIIKFNSYYISPNDNGEATYPMQIPYVHIKGATDELCGAKFIISYKEEIKNLLGYDKNDEPIYDIERYSQPLINGYKGRYNITFNSEYIGDGQIILAKGAFKESTYPTAIKYKEGENGAARRIVFYRDNIETAAEGTASDLFNASFAQENGFKKILLMIAAFFNPESIVGSINLDLSAMTFSYEPEEDVEITELKYNQLYLSYFLRFEPKEIDYNTGERKEDNLLNYIGGSTTVSKGEEGLVFSPISTLSFKDLFISSKFNILLIVAAPILLVKVCLSSLMALIQRSFELFLIILAYPTACVTLPLDDNAYNKWWLEYKNRLFSTYGIILGINFVFMLFPIIMGISFFQPHEIATSKFMYKLARLFFGNQTITQLTAILNSAVVILFEIVAFTLIETIPKAINQMIGAQEQKSAFMEGVGKLIKRFGKVMKVVGKAIGLVFSVIPQTKAMADAAKGINRSEKAMKNLNKMRNFKAKLIPGSALLDAAGKKATLHEKSQQTKKAMASLGEALDTPYEPGKKPQKSEFVDENEKDPEKKKQGEENYKKALEKYEKDEEERKKKYRENIEKQFDALIKAKKDELKTINMKQDDLRNQKKDEAIDRRLGILNDKDPEKDDDEKKSQSQKKMDGEDDGDDDSGDTPKENSTDGSGETGESGETGGSGETGESGEQSSTGGKKEKQDFDDLSDEEKDDYTDREVKREMRKSKRQYKKAEKMKKLLQKRLKWEEKHGTGATNISDIENALYKVSGEAEQHKSRYQNVHDYLENRREADAQLSEADLAAKEAKRKGAAKARKKERRKGALKRGLKASGKFVAKQTFGRVKSFVNKKREERKVYKKAKRAEIFRNTKGGLFGLGKLKNYTQRSFINWRLNRKFKKKSDKLKDIETLMLNTDKNDPKYAKYKKKFDQLKAEQEEIADEQSSLTKRRAGAISVKNKRKMEAEDEYVGLRGIRSIIHPIKRIKAEIARARVTKYNSDKMAQDIEAKDKEILDVETELADVRTKASKPGVAVAEQQRKMLELERRLEQLKAEKKKLEDEQTRNSQFAQNDNLTYYKVNKKKRDADARRERLLYDGFVYDEQDRRKKIEEEKKKGTYNPGVYGENEDPTYAGTTSTTSTDDTTKK